MKGKCDCCLAPVGWETEERYGDRRLELCESHAMRWLRAERELAAELEEMAGRRVRLGALGRLRLGKCKPRPGTVAALARAGRGQDKRRAG